jgi:hypothetical protein
MCSPQTEPHSSDCCCSSKKLEHPHTIEPQGHKDFSCNFDEFLLTINNLSTLLPTNNIQHVSCTVNNIDQEESCVPDGMIQQCLGFM